MNDVWPVNTAWGISGLTEQSAGTACLKHAPRSQVQPGHQPRNEEGRTSLRMHQVQGPCDTSLQQRLLLIRGNEHQK